jgi:hypothetical protein
VLNRLEPSFEVDLRKALAECRDHYKNFLFTSGLPGFAVKNPGLCVPELDEEGNRLWLEDPVHPTASGYSRIVDMVISDAERLRSKAGEKKRSGSVLEAASKRSRHDMPRPNWVAETCAATSMQDGARRGETVDVLPSKAVAEAVAGQEAEVTTVVEATVVEATVVEATVVEATVVEATVVEAVKVAADTSMAAGEAVAITIEFALASSLLSFRIFFSLSLYTQESISLYLLRNICNYK